MTSLDILFGAVGLITAASAVLAVSTQQLVHAALWLVVTLGTLAGCYLILGAELVALVQLLIYVGAVVVLVLFALMLTRAPMGPSPEHSSSSVQRVAAAVLGAGTTALLAAVLLPALGGEVLPTTAADTTAIATQLFGVWVWPFELLSVLLLVALIAALAVSRMPTTSPGSADDSSGSADTSPEPAKSEPATAESADAEPADAAPALAGSVPA